MDAHVDGFIKFFDDDIGYYSAKAEERSHIHGKVIIGLDESEISLLDDYEGVPQDVYKRIRVTATLADGGSIEAQLYIKGPKHFM